VFVVISVLWGLSIAPIKGKGLYVSGRVGVIDYICRYVLISLLKKGPPNGRRRGL
jgi:hypothetical protein